MVENITLDLKDRKILYELDLSARQTNSTIAKKVGLSKDTVNYRIKRMEEEKLIQGYYTIFDTSRLGYISFRVYLKFFEITNAKEQELIDYLVKSKKVGWVAKTEGNHDLAFMVWVKDVFEFNEFWINFSGKFKAYFDDRWISIWTKLYHYRRAYIMNLKEDTTKTEIMGGNREKAEIDSTDLEILKLLADNARIALTEIASKLNISERTIAYRIKALEEKGIILGYRALIDIEKLGYEYYKIDFDLRNIGIIKELIDIARINPNIIYVDEMISGTSDFEFDIQVKTKDDLFKLIKELKERFKSSIRSYEYSTTIKEYKLQYLPV